MSNDEKHRPHSHDVIDADPLVLKPHRDIITPESVPRLARRAKRTMGTVRAMDYRRPADQGGGRFQRCSRCHSERRLDSPVIYNLASRTSRPGQPDPTSTGLQPLMFGNELLGFVCADCYARVCRHMLLIFPDGTGFPHVDANGYLQPTPRCDECNAALQYASDGRSVLCPHCDADAALAELDEDRNDGSTPS